MQQYTFKFCYSDFEKVVLIVLFLYANSALYSIQALLATLAYVVGDTISKVSNTATNIVLNTELTMKTGEFSSARLLDFSFCNDNTMQCKDNTMQSPQSAAKVAFFSLHSVEQKCQVLACYL